MSLVNKNLKEWGIYFGVPARFIKKISKNLIEKEMEMLKELQKNESKRIYDHI